MHEQHTNFSAYGPDMMPALLDVWNAATAGSLPLGTRLWRQNVDNSPLFHAEDCRVALAEDGTVSGFVITRILTDADIAANPDMAEHRELGHVMLLAVHPRHQRQGTGSRLLEWAEERLRSQGAATICLWGPSGHLIPGPPAGDEAALTFWRHRGYVLKDTVFDVRAALDNWQPPEPPAQIAAGNYALVQGKTGEEDEIVSFMSAAFPGRWRYDMASAFERGYAPADVTLVRERGGQISGFLCAFHGESGYLGGGSLLYPLLRPGKWGGIGPLGISDSARGHGLGLALVAAGVSYLHGKGVRDCSIDWTTLVDFYGKLGFAPWKSYYIMEKGNAEEHPQAL